MTNKNMKSDLARANSLGIKLEMVVIVILTICYLIQSAKNSITTIGLVILLATLWIPAILAIVLNRANNESPLVKHAIGIGYGLFYVAVCIISDQQLVFTYAFPMLLVVAIYCDLKFSILVSGSVMVIAIIHAIFFTAKAQWDPVAIAAMEIEIAATVLVGVYSIIANKFVIAIQEKHLKAANDAGEKTEGMLSNILEVSNALVDEVQTVSERMEALAVSSNESLLAMEEVQQGANDSAEAVQSQLIKTEEIQNQIDKVTGASENIEANISEALEAIREGNANIEKLIKNAEASEVAANGAVNEVESLKNYTSQMVNIVSLIQEIAEQTSLLSLNASIEAARAGEAGRGFAVVAGEISSLSSQTQSATENISKLISSVTANMDDVAKAIISLVDSNKVQNESANVTAESFNKIAQSTEIIRENSNELAGIVESLDEANKEIVESIQVISAISEEVSAHATTTFEITEQNEDIVKEVQNVVVEMTGNAEKLKQI